MAMPSTHAPSGAGSLYQGGILRARAPAGLGYLSLGPSSSSALRRPLALVDRGGGSLAAANEREGGDELDDGESEGSSLAAQESLLSSLALLSNSHDTLPQIFIVTDGSVEDERNICHTLKTELTNRGSMSPRISTFGLGSYCNHYFLRMLASIGKGHYDAAFDTGQFLVLPGQVFGLFPVDLVALLAYYISALVFDMVVRVKSI